VPTDRRPSYFRRLCAAAGLVVLVAATLVVAAGTAAAAATTRVSNADIAPICPAVTTGYCTELHGAGTAAVVDDKRANAGRSYLRLTTLAPADHATVFAERFGGMRLADITDLAFETFVEQASAGGGQATPSINIPVVPNKTGVTSTFTTLVWEPTYTGTAITPNTWQHWTPSTAAGGWWATGSVTTTGTPNVYGFPTYTATFAQVKAALPQATVYAVGVNQGSGVTGLVAGVDQLRVNGTTFDFDNPLPTADLGVQINAPTSATPGTSFQATVRVTNAGTAPARTISTALMLGSGVQVTSAPGGIGLGGVAAYRTTELAAGRSVDFVVTLAVDAGARKPLMLFAATHSLVPDLNAQNNAIQVRVPLA
jgi:CARDB